MTYSSMIVQIEPDSFPNGRVHIAAQLAERFGARLIGVSAQALRPPFVAEGVVVDVDVLEAERQSIDQNLSVAEERFRAAAAISGRPVEWRGATTSPTEFLVQQSRGADLIIIGKNTGPEDHDLLRTVDPGDVVMKAGRPVLLLPDRSTSFSTERILLAWTDRREARRAIRDALPFLGDADEVILLGIEERAQAETAHQSIEDVAAYLVTHGIRTRIDLQLDVERSAAEEIMRRAEEEGADLIVAGGYGHSRLREWILGGVTRSLLRTAGLACLLSH